VSILFAASTLGIVRALLNALLVLSSLFLICLVLIQRGKGGGLAGAFGGAGGSSAFGTKAGDVFTRITIVVAAVWGILSMLLVILSNRGVDSAWGNEPRAARTSTEVPPTGAGNKTKAATPPPIKGGETPVPPPPLSRPSPESPVGAPAIPAEAPPASSKK
jgi:preprotein translocase subunit SecG